MQGDFMLSELAIKNFAIIDDIRIPFREGFSVLTGETGAGKSIIIEAVNLLMGSRASADLIRSGEQTAELEALFNLDTHSAAAVILKDQGIDIEEGLIIRRVISSTGKSKVFINSRLSTLELLKSITQSLATISSQHAHQGLINEENHLEILDNFSGTLHLKNEVKALYYNLMPLKEKISRLREQLIKKNQEQALLNFQINEIEDAEIQENEDKTLEEKRVTLLNASKIFEAVNGTVDEIYDRKKSLIERISLLQNDIETFRTKDEKLGKPADQLSSVIFDLQDIAQDLRNYSSTIDLDPNSLEQVQQRLDMISKMKRKYGGTLESLFEQYEEMMKSVFQIKETAKIIKGLEKNIFSFQEKLAKKAEQLSDKRHVAAKKLAKLAETELKSLEMDKACFEISFSHQDGDIVRDICSKDGKKIFPDGKDKVCFLLSPNPGEPTKPLMRIASGGELSRVVLALKAVLSKTQDLETLIFDEVDAGIGGATSEKVGLKLKHLASAHQVICITHLAQIAKYGSHQYKISKKVVNQRTTTSIFPLTQENERVEEIARMIGGKDITSATITHAKEMLVKALT
jgi:DNA repair protein RecN (Recombination protein N)